MDVNVQQGIKGKCKGGIVLQKFTYLLLHAMIQCVGVVFRISTPAFYISLKIKDIPQVTGVMLVKVIGLVHMSRITFMGHGGVEGAGICTLVINVNGIVFRPVNRYCKIESRA